MTAKIKHTTPVNKWKLAFFVCLIFSITSLVTIGGVAFYKILDVGTSLSYTQDSYDFMQADLNTLMMIINETDLSYTQIKQKLLDSQVLEDWYFDKYPNVNEIMLNNIRLHFEDGKLVKVETYQ